jgi:hypothetical protein
VWAVWPLVCVVVAVGLLCAEWLRRPAFPRSSSWSRNVRIARWLRILVGFSGAPAERDARLQNLPLHIL